MAKRTTRAVPPTTPQSWVAQDADLRRKIALPPSAEGPFPGAEPCACGGAWRYRLADGGRYRFVRCLHCGHVALDRAERATASQRR